MRELNVAVVVQCGLAEWADVLDKMNELSLTHLVNTLSSALTHPAKLHSTTAATGVQRAPAAFTKKISFIKKVKINV